jgi:hypothetical protein
MSRLTDSRRSVAISSAHCFRPSEASREGALGGAVLGSCGTDGSGVSQIGGGEGRSGMEEC